MTSHPITQRPPSTYFYPQQSSTSSNPQKLKSHTRVEKASAPTNVVTDYTNYNYNNIPQSGKFSSLITNVDKSPPIGVSIIQKSPKYTPDIAIETEDVKEEGEVITFWVDNPNDIPDIANANSYFHETPSSFLEGIGNNRKHDGQNFNEYDDDKNYIERQDNSLPDRPSISETDEIINNPIDFEPKGNFFNPSGFKSPQPYNFFASPELKLTKSTEAPSTYFSTSVINPQDYYGGFGTKTFSQPESRTKERKNALHNPTSHNKHRKSNHDIYPSYPSRRGGGFNKLTRFSARDARDKRKSEIYFSDAYLQGDFVQEDEDVEDIVEDDFLEEGEYLSNGEADLAFEKEGDSNPSLFSPDAPYKTNNGNIEESEAYSYPATEEEQVFIYKESEEKEQEEEKEVEPITEPPKKATRYKSTTSINKYKSKSSINKYKSQFEIKQYDQNQYEQNRKPKSETSKGYKEDSSYPITTTSKPKEAPSQVPTTYIKYSDTVPKSEIAQESDDEGGEENSYKDSHNSVFHSEDFSPGKFLTPENFEIPQEFRTFLSKPPSWINMENW